MSDEAREAAERIMHEATIYEWGHRTDPSLPSFERDILTVAEAALSGPGRLESDNDRLTRALADAERRLDLLKRLLHREHFFEAGRFGMPLRDEECPPCRGVEEELEALAAGPRADEARPVEGG